MKTNKSFISGIILGLLTILPSCSFLEIDMENKIATSDVDYSNTSEMYQPVIGAYAQLRISGMHWENNMLWAGRDDDMSSGRDDDQADALLFGYKGKYVCPNSYWALNNAWVTPYEIIRTCNSALLALDQYASYLSSSSTEYATYLSYCGEVRTIRAWSYYMLATTFGPCVILRDNNQTSYVRSTVEHVYEYIHEDLNFAIANMQRMRPNQMPHMGAYTAYTAEALDARLYLIEGNYAKAEERTDDIINSGLFSLYEDLYNLYKIPGKLCDESLMEVQCTDFGVATGDYIGIDQWFNFMGASLTLYNESGQWVNGIGGWTFMRYKPTFSNWAKWRGETIRLETSCMIGGQKTREGWTINGKSSEIYNGKAYLPFEQMTAGSTDWGRNNNVRLIRYAEVLLINAEAKVMLGKSGDAPLNLVRARAKMPALTGATLDNILDERRMELCSEWGLRYTDLVRTGKASTILKNYNWTTDKIYWPVPGTQLSTIPDMEKKPI